MKELNLMVGDSPLFVALKVKHGTVEHGDRQLGKVVFTYAQLNQVVGRLAAEGEIDILNQGVPLLRRAGEGMVRSYQEIAERVRKYPVPANLDFTGFHFEVCKSCSTDMGAPVGHFINSSDREMAIGFFSFEGAVRYYAARRTSMDPQITIGILQQVLDSGLPIEEPDHADGSPPAVRLEVMVISSRDPRDSDQHTSASC